MKNLTALLEGILFAATEPISSEQLSLFLGIEEDEILTELIALQKTFDKDHHGIRLVRHDKDFRFSTKPEYGEDIALFLAKKRPQLSNAALEVLSIAAYNQPVTKPYISQIRGVASSEIVDALEEKGLLQEDGRLDLPGRPMSYVTTDKFLTVFGLDSLADMPPLNPEEESFPAANTEILLTDAVEWVQDEKTQTSPEDTPAEEIQ
ncbi:MAG: SMC-Scp complex subunit ScpB [Clostridia bacterium]|nr:SMC-Scp complex subunit ScpB [Clostridia bacterium]